jgi:hypothetical protein
LSTPVKMVGATNWPAACSSGPVAGPPPSTQVRALGFARCRCRTSTFSYCGSRGHRADIGVGRIHRVSPMRAANGRARRAASVNRFADPAFWSSRREPAMQVWPVAAKMPEIDAHDGGLVEVGNPSNTMLGDLPPSSSETRLQLLLRRLRVDLLRR